MAFRAQGDEVVGRITACLPALDVVDMQLNVLGLSLAALAFMAITEQHVFTYIAESELFTLLVIGVPRQLKPLFPSLQQLGIKLCGLNRYLPDRQERSYLPNPVDVTIYLLSYGRRKPPRLLGSGPVQ
jgi:hypothetical protein